MNNEGEIFPLFQSEKNCSIAQGGKWNIVLELQISITILAEAQRRWERP
jgi:hypothetical protein